MKRHLFLMVFAMITVAATAARAGQWYARADAGYGWSSEVEIKDKGACDGPGSVVGCEKVEGDFGNGYGLNLGVGNQIVPWLRVEADVTYRNGYSFDVKGVNVSQDLDTWTGMAKAYLDVRGLTNVKMGVFHPFVGAGLGVSHNTLDTLHGINNTNAPGGERTDFAWSLTAGTGIMVINKKLMFDIAYSYSDLGEAGGDAGPAFDGIGNYSANATETHVRLHEVTAGLRYMF